MDSNVDDISSFTHNGSFNEEMLGSDGEILKPIRFIKWVGKALNIFQDAAQATSTDSEPEWDEVQGH